MSQPEKDTEYLGLPEHLRNGFRAYIGKHRPMGGFGMAVLRNDLTEACGRADEINRPILADIVRWLHNEAPAACWGSPEKVRLWLAEV